MTMAGCRSRTGASTCSAANGCGSTSTPRTPAAREVARVLAPGGRAAIVDTDWATAVMTPADPGFERRYNEAAWRRMANPFSGRHLRGQLRAAGLTVDDEVGSAALVMPDEMLRNPQFFLLNAALSVEEGAVTQEEVDAHGRGSFRRPSTGGRRSRGDDVRGRGETLITGQTT